MDETYKYNIIRERLMDIFKESKPFKQFWYSYFIMLLNPKTCFLFINFACRVTIKYNLTDDEDAKNIFKMYRFNK